MIDVPTVFGDEGGFSRLFSKGNVTDEMKNQEISCPHCKHKQKAGDMALFTGVPILGEYNEAVCPNCDKSFGLRWENDKWNNHDIKI